MKDDTRFLCGNTKGTSGTWIGYCYCPLPKQDWSDEQPTSSGIYLWKAGEQIMPQAWTKIGAFIQTFDLTNGDGTVLM